MNRHVEALLSGAAEAAFCCWPRRKPSRAQLDHVRIVSHRGERDNVRVRENTIAAFDAALAAGVWGIEFDVRYTRDGEPVVVHDADLSRVFGIDTIVADTTWRTLRELTSEVTHLQDFLTRFAHRAHLMLELKARDRGAGEARLLRLLEPLEPVRDFHLLALNTALFDSVAGLPPRCYLPVAKFNVPAMHRYALDHGCAGLAGPYQLMKARHIAELKASGRRAGSGFASSRGVLYREIARGVDWVFSNDAVRLQRFLDAARDG